MDISSLASLLMALGAPIVYADQAYSIYRKQDARGFSHDVCAVLLIANITRCFFWLGERFEFALLLQSLLMIAAQLGLLYLCIRFKPVTRWSKSISSDGARVLFNANDAEEQQGAQRREEREEERDLMDLNTVQDHQPEEEEEGYADKQPLLVTLGAMFRGNSTSSSYGRLSSNDPTSSYSSVNPGLPQPNAASAPTASQSRLASLLSHLRPGGSGRPLNFWQWSDYNSYLIFLFLYILFLLILYISLSWSTTFIALLGYIALGLESTLPIPQLIANYRRKSLAGFRASVLVGWLGGDSFKLLYFLLKASPIQFTACAVFQLSVDLAILAQSRLYRAKTEEDEEEMRRKAEERSAGGAGQRGRSAGEGEIERDESDELPPRGSLGRGKAKAKAQGKPARQQPREEQDLLQDPHHVISIEADDDDDEQGDISNGRK